MEVCALCDDPGGPSLIGRVFAGHTLATKIGPQRCVVLCCDVDMDLCHCMLIGRALHVWRQGEDGCDDCYTCSLFSLVRLLQTTPNYTTMLLTTSRARY